MMVLVSLSLEKADGDMGISWGYVTGSIVLFTDSRELEQYLADQRYSKALDAVLALIPHPCPERGLEGYVFF